MLINMKLFSIKIKYYIIFFNRLITYKYFHNYLFLLNYDIFIKLIFKITFIIKIKCYRFKFLKLIIIFINNSNFK